MWLNCCLVVAYVVALSRLLPQHVFENRRLFNLSSVQTARLWEETASLLWYFCNVCYMLSTHVSFHFFFHSPLTLDAAGSHSAEHDGVRLLLACNMSFYAGLLVVALWKPRRRDWAEMVAHHLITICLMGVAYAVGFYDVSVFVLFINALADVFLSSSRMAYDVGSTWQTPLFACFVVVHLFLRVVFYPVKVWECFFSSMDQYQGALDYLPGLCTVPLWLLYLFWTPKIFRVCWRRAVHGERDVDKSVRQKKSQKNN